MIYMAVPCDESPVFDAKCRFTLLLPSNCEHSSEVRVAGVSSSIDPTELAAVTDLDVRCHILRHEAWCLFDTANRHARFCCYHRANFRSRQPHDLTSMGVVRPVRGVANNIRSIALVQHLAP